MVGAGVAGLTCAWSLLQRGHEVEVLEAGATVGGRVRSKRTLGFPFERGARWLGDEPTLHELLRRLSLADQVRPIEAPSFVLGPDGLVKVEPGDALLPGEPIATGTRYTLEGGLSRFTRALADALTVRLGWGAESVASDPLGIRVRFIAPSGERTLRAEAAVLAVSSPVARGLAPELPPPIRTEKPATERFGLVHLGLAAPVSQGDVRVPSASGLDLAGWSVVRCAEGCAVRVALRPEVAERLWSAPDSAWVDHVTGQLERTPLEKVEPVLSAVDRFQDPAVDPEGPLWSGRIGVTGAAGSVAGAAIRGLAAAAGVARALAMSTSGAI